MMHGPGSIRGIDGLVLDWKKMLPARKALHPPPLSHQLTFCMNILIAIAAESVLPFSITKVFNLGVT
jgi:hypothetical protein